MAGAHADSATRRPTRPARPERGRAHLAGVGPRGRQRHHRRVPQPGRAELAADGERDRQRPRSSSSATDAAGALTSTAAQVVDAINAQRRGEPAARGDAVHRVPRSRRRGHRHRPAAGEGQPVRLPHHGDERPRPARAVRVLGDADRQAARRLEGRRLPVLPAARPRVGDAADVPGDGRAAAAQLRDRPGDARARRQPRHLHPAVVEPGRRALLDAQLRPAAAQHDELLRRRRQGDRRPVRGELLDAADAPRARAPRTPPPTPPRATRGAST